MASIPPEVRDTIRAPASNYLPSLSIRVPRRALTAGGITGRWPSFTRKASLKSNDYFLIAPSCLIRTLQLRPPLISHTLSSLSFCLPGSWFSILPENERHQWSSVVLSWEILELWKLIRKFWFWSSCLYTTTHVTHTHTFRAGTQSPQEVDVSCMGHGKECSWDLISIMLH